MASLHIHLAIGNLFIKKNNISNGIEFIHGTLDPDLTNDKRISHYTGTTDKTNLIKYLNEKVLLYEFLSQNDINSDYQKAVFLHLITDYLFFNSFFDREYIIRTPYQEYIRNLYYSYNMVSDYLVKKYDLDFKDYKQKIIENIDFYCKKRSVTNYDQCVNIIPYDKLDRFIEDISSIDICEYKVKIMKNKRNVLP